MRNAPSGVGGVSVKSSSQVIEDAAHAHGLQGLFYHLQGKSVFASLPVTEKKEEVVRGGELGCAAKAAVLGIIDGCKSIIAPLQKGFV